MRALTQQKKNWFRQKIKGDFAEAVCETHFSSLNYHVEKVGIESIAPMYVKRSNTYKQNFVRNQLNKTPDFLISNETDAFFVEVKFRGAIENDTTDFYQQGAKLILQYKDIILKPEFVNDIDDSMEYKEVHDYIRQGGKLQENTKVIFYVVLPQKIRDSYVHLFLPQLVKGREYGWRSFKVEKIDEIFGIEGLKERYESLIEPVLDTIFNNQETT